VDAPLDALPLVLLPGFGNCSRDYECPFGDPDDSVAATLRVRSLSKHHEYQKTVNFSCHESLPQVLLPDFGKCSPDCECPMGGPGGSVAASLRVAASYCHSPQITAIMMPLVIIPCHWFYSPALAAAREINSAHLVTLMTVWRPFSW
jgi:hypothetical protein